MTDEARTRNARKKARRAERQAAEREAAAAQARRERLRLIAAAVGTATVVVVGVGLLVATQGSDEAAPPANGSQVDEAGLQNGPPPWEARTEGFTERVSALGFPPVGDESYHAHALLSVYRNGKSVPVPPTLGFGAGGEHASLHAHYPNGVIHLEADDPYPYTIKDVFTVWGVRFDATRLGGDVATGANTVHVLVNGKPAVNGPETEIKDGDNVVVAFGAAGSFPKEPDLTPLKDEVQGS